MRASGTGERDRWHRVGLMPPDELEAMVEERMRLAQPPVEWEPRYCDFLR